MISFEKCTLLVEFHPHILYTCLSKYNLYSHSLDEGVKGNCTCGGFSSNTFTPGVAPLISQSPGLEVKCDDDGDKTCKQLCTALATAAKAKGPDVLCNRLKDAEELKVNPIKILRSPAVALQLRKIV